MPIAEDNATSRRILADLLAKPFRAEELLAVFASPAPPATSLGASAEAAVRPA